MRIVQPLLYLLCCVLGVGCAYRRVTPHHENAVLLDNHGGISHAGRRIVLRSDGSYVDTFYTDVVGNVRAESGRYALNAEGTHLTLSPEPGAVQHLYRVDYRGQRYWVREDERARLIQSSEAWLRQISLRVVP